MEFCKVIENRFSVREYDEKTVEEDVLQRILEVFRTSPTAKNRQPVRLIVVKDKDMLEKIDGISPCRYGATLAFLVCSDENEAWIDRKSHSRGEMDATIAATHIMLSCTNEGLGTCWVCLFDEDKTRALFELPDNIKPQCFIMAGYPKENTQPNERHTIRHELRDTVKII